MKKYLVLLLLMTSTLQAQLSDSKLKDNGIYLSATDFQNKKLTHPFDKGEGLKFKENKKLTTIIKAVDTSYKFYNDNIWGYRMNGTNWRFFNEQFYRVDFVGGICIYTILGTPVLSIPDWSYFSLDIISPIHELTRKNLVEVFNTDTAFVSKISNLPLTTSLFKWDKARQRYLFINWLSDNKHEL